MLINFLWETRFIQHKHSRENVGIPAKVGKVTVASLTAYSEAHTASQYTCMSVQLTCSEVLFLF